MNSGKTRFSGFFQVTKTKMDFTKRIGKFWRETFVLFTHPDGEAAKLPEAEVRSTRASSEKLNAANKTFSFLDLQISNFSMLILTIKDTFFAK